MGKAGSNFEPAFNVIIVIINLTLTVNFFVNWIQCSLGLAMLQVGMLKYFANCLTIKDFNLSLQSLKLWGINNC